MSSSVIYFADTLCEKQRFVYQMLFNSMRWNYWWEISENLRYTNLNVDDIDTALDELTKSGKIETSLTHSGCQIWRVVL